MKTFEYSPIPDIEGYVVYPSRRRLRRILMDSIAYNPMPRFTNWMIYQVFRDWY